MPNMSIGIYKLKFEGTNKIYIGQSKNITTRMSSHRNNLKAGKAAAKLQDAYNLYGMPTIETIIECEVSELDENEILAIEAFDSVNNGFNTREGGTVTPIMEGVDNHNSKYSEEDYIKVLKMLAEPGNSWKHIEEITGVSRYVVSHISGLESHRWLKTRCPEEYSNIEYIKTNGGRNFAMMQGISYPDILSPEGIVYKIDNPTRFAREHGLLQPKLHEVLTGARNTHKGWKLVSTELKSYPDVISPDGIVFSIAHGSANKFASENHLSAQGLSKLLTGKAKSHKGWTLASKK